MALRRCSSPRRRAILEGVDERAPLTTVICTLLLGACGGGDDTPRRAVTAPRQQAPATNPLALPTGVPRSPTGPADPAATQTIRGWAHALRGGDVAAAAGFWALPSKIQNGTPVLTLGSREDLRLFNGSLSCGAVLTSAGSARGYTIATFRLTERRGGDCATGTGHSAQTAILVRSGKIAGWYRLPEAGSQTPDAPGSPAAPVV